MVEEPIVDIRRATVYRGDTRVFADLTLTLTPGRHTVILGPNGAGKSTLLKLLTSEVSAVARPESSVRLFGTEQWNVWEVRRRLGLVSQDLQQTYLESSSGLEVVLSGYRGSIGVYPHQGLGQAERRCALEMLQWLGVPHLRDRLFAACSTGEQRRLLLGRALVHDPEALVLDEPTSGLDVGACFLYLDLVRNLMHRGRTVILVTHHLHEIPPEISRVVFLKDGRVVADGTKEDLLTSERLGDLFGRRLRLMALNGFYQAFPG